MEAILDFTKPLDPALMDEVVSAFYTPGNPQVFYLLLWFRVASKGWATSL